jgi:pyruvate formate lyase activating enzyme
MGSPVEPSGHAELLGTIVSVQHFCMHDGPGTRSVVFFKGCPLRCAWCSNAEAWSRRPQLAHKAHVCINCRRCVEACPLGVMTAPGEWDVERCDACGLCAEACPARALVLLGQRKGVEALLAELRREYGLYAATGGGVTFSGGEATLQAAFAAEFGRRLRAEGVHLTLETCGVFKRTPEVDALLAVLDLVLFDIKLFDDDDHRRWCGAGNRLIKANLEQLHAEDLAGRGPIVWPRMPLIPTVTATRANVEGWAKWLVERGMTGVSLVPYHEYGASKREWLGPGVPAAPELPLPNGELIAEVKARFASFGVRTYAPGKEPLEELVRESASRAGHGAPPQ